MGQGYGRDGPYGGEGVGGHNAPAPVYAPPPEEAVETLMVRQLQAHTCSSNCLVLSCHILYLILCLGMLCHIISCLVLSCHVMSCHVMSCHVMSCHVMSCLVIPPAPCPFLHHYAVFSFIASHTNSLSQGMGFDRPAVLAALQSNGNSVEAAANMLLR